MVRGRAAPVGESLSITETIDETLEEVTLRLAEGYRRIKLKIQPGWDVEVVSAVRELVGDDVMLQVDANAAYSLADADRLAKLDDYGLACIEQPLGWDQLLEHAELQRRIATPVCLDESLRSVGRRPSRSGHRRVPQREPQTGPGRRHHSVTRRSRNCASTAESRCGAAG